LIREDISAERQIYNWKESTYISIRQPVRIISFNRFSIHLSVGAIKQLIVALVQRHCRVHGRREM